MKNILCLITLIQIAFANDVKEELLKYLYDNRGYYAENSKEFVLLIEGTERIITKNNEVLYAPYRDSSYESFAQNHEHLMSTLPYYSTCSPKNPNKPMRILWDSVAVKGLILSLALNPTENRETITTVLEILENGV